MRQLHSAYAVTDLVECKPSAATLGAVQSMYCVPTLSHLGNGPAQRQGVLHLQSAHRRRPWSYFLLLKSPISISTNL